MEKGKGNLTSTISSGAYNECKTFEVSQAFEEPENKGYLFADFEGSGERNKQEQLRF